MILFEKKMKFLNLQFAAENPYSGPFQEDIFKVFSVTFKADIEVAA
jgi:hypothetical protein